MHKLLIFRYIKNIDYCEKISENREKFILLIDITEPSEFCVIEKSIISKNRPRKFEFYIYLNLNLLKY
jgi:hypothetical protein